MTEPTIIDTAPTGATYITEHMSRKSRAYLISDSELSSLAAMDAVVGICGTLVLLSASMILTAWWDVGYAEGDAKFAAGWIIGWSAGLLATGGLGGFLFYKRTTIVRRIKSESFGSSRPTH